jgi:hypothetical protein
MFLFAKLVMENLYSQTKRANLTKELEPDKFPRGLEDAYVFYQPSVEQATVVDSDQICSNCRTRFKTPVNERRCREAARLARLRQAPFEMARNSRSHLDRP